MRICIVYSGSTSKKLEAISKSLLQGVESQGNHIVDLIDIDKDSDKKLTGYKYILWGCGKASFLSNKVPQKMVSFVKNCGHVAGKHVFAFTEKALLSQSFLLRFMALLESEGVILRTSGIIKSVEEAKIKGSKLHIK